MIKKTLLTVFAVITIFILWNYELVAYGIAQAKGQVAILWNARNISKVLEDPHVADSVKNRIQLVQEIKAFAVQQIGVKPTDNYTTYYDQQGKPVLWVVRACQPFQLKNKEWSFPLIGTFSYKGFFDKERAKKEMEKLKASGYDTGARTTNAWSTLGYFKDPILSGFLAKSEGEIANTIIHELTHGTLFVKDSLQFNENIATFFGNKGAESFLIHKYGTESKEYQTYIDRMNDREIYTQHMLRGARQLDSLYATFGNVEEIEKQQKKEQMIRHIIARADTLSLKSKEKYAKLFRRYLQPDSLPNNTFFMSYMRYRGKQDALEEECMRKFNGQLKPYLQYLTEKY